MNIEKLNRLYDSVEYRMDVKSRLNMVDLYHKYHVEPLECRRKKNLLKILYKESKVDANIDMYRPQRVLHSANHVKMKHKFTRLTKIQTSPYYIGLELWDKLPQELETITTNAAFKSAIKDRVGRWVPEHNKLCVILNYSAVY